jgi:HD-like signal output (HDOD) protein
MDLNQLLESPLSLPHVPRVVALLLFQLEQPQPDLMRVTQLVSSDPGLTFQLLQVANSPYFEMQGRIHSASESLALLGIGHLRSAVTQARENAAFRAPGGFLLPQYWSYCLNVGKVSRSLAGVLRTNQQEAFTAGLIHSLGELVLMQALPGQMADISKTHGPLALRRPDAETRALGYNYAQVTAGLAERYHLPRTTIEALQEQCCPFESDSYEPLAGILHLATWRARAKEAGLDQRGLAVSFPGSVGDILKLDIDTVLQQDPIDWYQTQRQQL